MHRCFLCFFTVILVVTCEDSVRAPLRAAAPSPSQPATGPEFVIDTGEPWKYGRVVGTYVVALADQTGNEVYRCQLPPARSAQPCSPSNVWFGHAARYQVTVQHNEDAQHRRLEAVQSFWADGSELGFEVRMSFMSEREAPLRLAEVFVMRLSESIPGVVLREAWSAQPTAAPAYFLVNNSRSTIYGVGWMGNFFGFVQRFADGKWTNTGRGGFCGTVALGEPLSTGARTPSIEGFFMGEVPPFTAGRYRYVVRYSTVEKQIGGVPSKIWDSGRTYTHFSEFHVARAEFSILR